MAFERPLRIKTNNIFAVFSVNFYSVKRDSCDIGFRVQFNVEFSRQVMDFPIEDKPSLYFSIERPPTRQFKKLGVSDTFNIQEKRY